MSAPLRVNLQKRIICPRLSHDFFLQKEGAFEMNRRTAAARIVILLTLILVMISGSAAAENDTAGTMRLLRYEGSVEIFDPEGVPRFVLENVRFASGEAMQTGEDGLASIGLDAS